MRSYPMLSPVAQVCWIMPPTVSSTASATEAASTPSTSGPGSDSLPGIMSCSGIVINLGQPFIVAAALAIAFRAMNGYVEEGVPKVFRPAQDVA